MMDILPCRILIVDDSISTLQLILEGLEELGYWVEGASSAEEAFSKADQNSYDIIITDLVMPGVSGMEVLAHFTSHFPETAVIFLTGYATIGTAVEAMRRGAFDYLTKPIRLDEIILVVKKAQEFIGLKMENLLLRSNLKGLYHFDTIIGQSHPMEELYKVIQRVSGNNSTVLIQGESGTGKELIAHAIHRSSPRSEKPLVPINCGAIPEELTESELFGHEKGAFTGALQERRGRFELANGGTIFLDEIGEMSPKLQVKLLRFLQEQKFERVGGTRTMQVDVRVIAATNKNLEEEVAAGNFREDLFYRLNVIPIYIAPLRERKGDVPLLVHHFLKEHCRKKGIAQKTLSRPALEALEAYEWPGNVRELENIIERLLILSDKDEIQLEELPQKMRQEREFPSYLPFTPGAQNLDLKQILDGLEHHLILEALKKASGVKNQAAKFLGLNRTTLIEKMKKRKIHYP